jgi:hypothetical protein
MNEMPAVRLASCGEDQFRPFKKHSTWTVKGETVKPSMLFSYAYEKQWLRSIQERSIHIRNFVLDSGAFTAHSSGNPIDIQAYIDRVKWYSDNGVDPVEIFSLDVIGDWRGTKSNTGLLWRAGVEAIPAFHYGEPEDVLVGYARDYPKIALGGAVGIPRKEKERWARQCFARVWPKPIHGFGFGMWALEVLPFHSIDCSDWFGKAKRFGKWTAFGDISLGLGGQNVLNTTSAEVQTWLDYEVLMRKRWASTFTTLGWTREGQYSTQQGAPQ